jgi:hypothetical protein
VTLPLSIFACGVPQLWENSPSYLTRGEFREVFTPKDAIPLTSVKSKLLSATPQDGAPLGFPILDPANVIKTKAHPTIILAIVSLVVAGCVSQQSKVTLELFLVSPAADKTITYGRLSADLSKDTSDPDTVARSLIPPACSPAILHSTSWRWEMNGTLILTYLAFSEDPKCGAAEPLRLAYRELVPPQSTDPQKPRPAEIREQDVLAHGIRHITFLVRHSADRRIAEALSPQSLKFFQSMCAQLAGRYETAREFADCAGKETLK